MVEFVSGDILDLAEEGNFDIIVHGCNCYNVMGAGIAKQIKLQYPETYNVDKNFMLGYYNLMKLGNFSTCFHQGLGENKFQIINAYTQHGVSASGEDVFEYDSFQLILRKLSRMYPNARYGFPYIGCGLAGGDEKTIVSMICDFETLLDGGTVTMVKYDG